MIQFIERIESADLTAPDIDEDDTNISWGHSQFTAGSMTCTTVLKTWSEVGDTQTAYRLIAASLKTCLVACHLCFTNKVAVPSSSSYLSDSYLQEVVRILWELSTKHIEVSCISRAFIDNLTFDRIIQLLYLRRKSTILSHSHPHHCRCHTTINKMNRWTWMEHSRLPGLWDHQHLPPQHHRMAIQNALNVSMRKS